jgi:hypothetical protein
VNRRLVGLGAVAAALGGYLVVENPSRFQPGPAVTPVAGTAAPHAPGTVKLNPLQDLDPQAYGNVLDRPLFNPGRRARPPEPEPVPQPVVEQPVEQPPPPPQGPGPDDYKLLGVASGPDGRVAAIRIAASGQVVYLRKGGTIDSWTVLDVADRSVAIGTAENPVTFGMFANTDAAAGTPDPSAGQPPPPPLTSPLPQPAAPQ